VSARVTVYVTEHQPRPYPMHMWKFLQRTSLIFFYSSYTYLADLELVHELCKFADSFVFQKPFLCLMLSDT